MKQERHVMTAYLAFNTPHHPSILPNFHFFVSKSEYFMWLNMKFHIIMPRTTCGSFCFSVTLAMLLPFQKHSEKQSPMMAVYTRNIILISNSALSGDISTHVYLFFIWHSMFWFKMTRPGVPNMRSHRVSRTSTNQSHFCSSLRSVGSL